MNDIDSPPPSPVRKAATTLFSLVKLAAIGALAYAFLLGLEKAKTPVIGTIFCFLIIATLLKAAFPGEK